MKRMFWIVPVALTMALGAATLPATPALAQKGGSAVRMRIDLAGGAINRVVPKGRAEFNSSASFRSLKVQVEKVNLPDGTTLTVGVNGSNLGMITLVAMRGEIEVTTKNGTAVPAIQAGDVVTVTASSGTLILQGKF